MTLSITVFGCIVTMYVLHHLFSIFGELLWREDFDSLFCNRCEVSACVYGSPCFSFVLYSLQQNK